jgi:hypothetical protein
MAIIDSSGGMHKSVAHLLKILMTSLQIAASLSAYCYSIKLSIFA